MKSTLVTPWGPIEVRPVTITGTPRIRIGAWDNAIEIPLDIVGAFTQAVEAAAAAVQLQSMNSVAASNILSTGPGRAL